MSVYSIKWEPIGADERAKKLKVFHEENSMEVDMVKSVPGGMRMPSDFVEKKWAERIYNFRYVSGLNEGSISSLVAG